MLMLSGTIAQSMNPTSLKKNQNEAARIVTGATKLVSIYALLTETRWETLSSRRTKHNLTLFYKMKNNLCPSYLASLVPNNVGDVSMYNLRNVQHSQTVHAYTQLYFNSFLPSVIREWNALSQTTRELSSMDCFANQLNSDIIPPQKLYFQGNRLAQIYHARLRTGCSTLRLHLYSKNIIENPLCNCGEIEDPFHFFFECNQYNLIRRDMLTCISAICNPNLNILLHGNDGLSEEQNLNTFMTVHNFIIKSKRFSLA